MLLGDVAHRETGLHGMELVLGLDLHHDQRHRWTMMDAMMGNLLDTGQDVVEAGIDEEALGVDGRRSHVHR